MPAEDPAKHDSVVPSSDEEKMAAFDNVERELAVFFTKYGGLDVVGRMSTINAYLKRQFPSWHFVGFYMVEAAEIDGAKHVTIGPFQGDVLATGRIAFGRGQCGACAAMCETQIQEDVSVCANYIPCDDVTRSEIVVPVLVAGPGSTKSLIAVLDIDSPILGNFNGVDKRRLEALMATYF